MKTICINIPSFTRKNGVKVKAHKRCYKVKGLTESQKEKVIAKKLGIDPKEILV